jgi:hypothetical protein
VRLLRNNVEVGSDPDGGAYSITTAALADGLSNFVSRHEDLAGNVSGNSAILSVTIDTVAPAVSGTPNFRFATAPHSLQYTFSEDVGATLANGDFAVARLPSTAIVTAMTYDAGARRATLTFPVNGVLPDGRYTSTLFAPGITDVAGNAPAADHVFDFLFMIGDANNDGFVNLGDFNILATNFGQSPRNFTQGDFNYDGQVNLQDFNILATRFGGALAPAASSPPAAPSRLFDEMKI